MNTAYRDLMLARVHAAIDAARAVLNIRHNGLKGQLREIVIRDLFRPLLPADVGLGTGEIVSANNRHSKQQDVVMFDQRILPPILLEESVGLFPIESVLYTVEVKSTLNASELKDSHRSATELRGFGYQSGKYDERDSPERHTVRPVISTILAFDTDLVPGGKPEVQRYDEVRGSEFPAIQAMCVVGKGYWYNRDGQWKEWTLTYPLEEVVGFVAGIMNTYRDVAESREAPRLGRYLIDG